MSGAPDRVGPQAAGAIVVGRESPLSSDLALLHDRHHHAMHEETPPESIHMMSADALAVPGIDFFVLRDEGRPLAMGAIKRISADHAEIKSMHVLAEARGRGLARVMLTELLAAADALGYRRVSLETGVQPGFAAARQLYAQAGFADCPPFEGYGDDPNSVFMTRTLG